MSENFKLSIEVVAAVGSFLSGVIMLITMIRVVSRLKFKEEVLYGSDATEQYDKIKDKLYKKGGLKIEQNKYEGGKNKITPRLEFEKFHYNPDIMEDKLKKYKKRIRFFDEERNVTTWYLK